MPKIVIPNNKVDHAKQFLLLSNFITEDEASLMIMRYARSPYSFSLPVDVNFALIRQINDYQNVPAGMKKGLGILPGRDGRSSDINIAIEPVLYERESVTDEVISCHRLENTDYFGRLSPNFRTQYSTSSGRSIVDEAIKIKDQLSDPGTEIILVDFKVLTDFSGNASDFHEVRIQFARNSAKKLTVVLSRRLEGGKTVFSRIQSLSAEIDYVTGVFLDDHDLIPPPDVES